MSKKVTEILRSELLYFAISMTLLVIFNGLLSFIVIQALNSGEALPATGDAMVILGRHVYWIIPLNLLIITYIMVARHASSLKNYLLQLLKTTLYFFVLTLIMNLLR